jgi:WD domain, G-beta repeat
LGEESPLWVVATVRSEFLSSAPERAGIAEAVDDPLLIEPLSRARLPEVIERPAQRAGVDFEAGLVERVVEETSGGDALPLLAYTLQELWERVGPEGTIRLSDYEAVGGVVGALRRRADRITDELTRRGQGPLILPTLLKLASIEGEEEPTRRRLRRGELAPKEQEVVDAFVEARLLTSGKSEEAGEEDGAAFVEVAHEALLRQWAPLRQAIEEERSSSRMRSELERLATDWDQARRKHENEDSYLLVRGRLAEFRDWADQHAAELGPIEREFLRASEALEERRIRRLRAVAGGLGILLVISVIVGVLAIWQTQQARSNAQQARMQANLALSRQLLAQASELQEGQPDTSLLLNLEALRRAPAAAKDEARFALMSKLDRPYHVATQLTGHTDVVSGVAFSPDGKLLATAGWDQTVRLWDVATGKQRGEPLTDHTDEVWGVAFSPDGKLLASSSYDNTVRLWDLEVESLVAEACTIANRDLSQAEWSRFVGPEFSYVRTCSSLPAGYGAQEHVTDEFEPAFRFEVGKDWEFAAPETTNELSLWSRPEGGDLIFTNPRHVFDSSNLSELKELPAPDNAAEWVSWFQRHPNLDTSKPVPVSVGGASGKRIDVTYASTPENYPRDYCGEEPCVPLYPTSESGIVSYDGWKDRFVIVDVGEETVLIDVAAPAETFDAFFPKAQKVLDTVEWKGA